MTERRTTLSSLTGMRAIAAALVFVYHLVWMVPGLRAGGNVWAGDLLERIAIKGYVGVGFFFVLSGFVLAWSQRPKQSKPDFWWRRAARIYPNHIVTWVLAAGLVAAGIVAAPPAGAAIANLLLLPHIFVPGAEWTVMNDPSWSIEVEAVFYLCFPFVFLRMTRARDAIVRRSAIVAAAITIGLPVLIILAGAGQDEGLWRLLYFFPIVRLPEFVAGMALGVLAARAQWFSIDPRLAWLLVALAFGACTFAPVPLSFAAIMLVPFLLLLMTYARRDVAGERSVLSTRTWVHLGVTSYAFYMVHGLVIRVVEHWTGPVPLSVLHAVALTAVCLALSLAGAEVLHRAVEVPVLHLVQRRTRRAAAPQAP